jgi:hypothetical protein
MAESIYTVLKNGKTMTAVKGYGNHAMMLPAGMPLDTDFEDGDRLLAWAKDNGCLHACLQKGVQKHLIDLRAAFRSVKKGETWQAGKAGQNVDTLGWKVQERPNQGGSKAVDQARYADCMKAIAGGVANGMDPTMLHTVLDPVYGAEMITTCLTAIQTASDSK